MNLLALVGVAVASFAGTNVDNLGTTAAQVASAKPGRVRRIIGGQYAGFVVVVLIAAAVAAALTSVPTHWIGLLGLVPIVLGVRALLALRRPEGRAGLPRWPTAQGSVTAALVTLGSGGDNLAVYIPLFRSTSLPDGLLVAVVLAACDALLCLVARTVGRHPASLPHLQRAGALATPILYLAVGVLVLWHSGTVTWLF